jgi:hypothetical protein
MSSVEVLEGRIVVPWRARSGQSAVIAAIPFTGVLLYLALASQVFEPVHRVLMGSFAAAIAYAVAAQLINVTRLSWHDARLRVEHGPLPWRRPLVIAVGDVRKLAVDRPGARLRLRTREGEEIDLVDNVGEVLAGELEAALARVSREG